MKKLGSIIYNKLFLQAEEAKEQYLYKIAEGLKAALEQGPSDELDLYSYNELNEDVNKDLWKLATNIIKYYDLKSIDAQKLNESIEILASRFIDDIENTLEVECNIGVNENKVPGEK